MLIKLPDIAPSVARFDPSRAGPGSDEAGLNGPTVGMGRMDGRHNTAEA
jgi:hypothetical protein